MDTKTTIAKTIEIADDKARYDAACKKLLSEKIILAWIMKDCLEEYREFDVNEIARRYIEGKPQVAKVAVLPDETNAPRIRGTNTEDASLNEGKVTYDIRFLAIVPISGEYVRLIINIEAQNNFYPGYPLIKRGIYYSSRMISAQYGTEFTDDHYEKIKKVYSIWICTNPPQKWENSITRYCVKEENVIGYVRQEKTNYDLITVVMIFLGNSESGNYAGVLKLLEVLLSSEKGSQEKKKILEEDFSIKMTRKLEREVSRVCNLSKGVEEKGIKKGIEQGKKIGKKEGILETLASLVKDNVIMLEEAARRAGMSPAEFKQRMKI